MMMKELLNSLGLESGKALSVGECKVIRPYLLERAQLDDNATVIMMLIPYRSELSAKNLSVYASVPDYHRFVDTLRAQITEYMNNRYSGAHFAIFSDHSPIDEVNGACLAGLGFIGDNGLLINEKYSSFVFLCELITDLSAEELGFERASDVSIKRCLSCGACMRACPSNCMDPCDPRPKSECLSAITQKKGELSLQEIRLMLDNGSIWGCDICQNVCPYTKGAEFTPIDYFKNGVITELTSELINEMSDEEFLSRPFSWRGRAVILRNTRLYEDETERS